nr:pilus assembly PilX N-terminal domain-containing protein [Vallitaleaceae bacterium]
MKKLVFLKNSKGSTLLMVLIMSVVLTVLGTALISMSFMNINMKYNDLRGKVSRYYSEAGIDEAYAVVAHYVDEDLVYASYRTAIELEDYKKNVAN